MAIRQRSPNYPGFDLGEALEALKRLYPKVQRGEFTPTDATGPWGYNTLSGPVRRKFGALRQYGLLEQKKGDTAKLTPRALTLVLRNPASAEYQAARRDAALEPDLIRELYENGKATAADGALRQDLIVHRGFTDDGADRFIEVLRATLSLAGLTDSATIAGQEEDESSEKDKGGSDMPPAPPSAADKFVLSIAGGPASFRIELPFPLTDIQWAQLTGMMDAVVKPTLVKSPGQVEAAQQTEGRGSLILTPVRDEGLVSYTRESESSLTDEAQDLLKRTNGGSVPAFTTSNLVRIATENGVSVSPDMTPNQIIDELRARAE